MKRITAGVLLTLMTTAGWADDWECKQLRDVIVSPPITWIKKAMSHSPLMSVAPKSRYCLRPFRFSVRLSGLPTIAFCGGLSHRANGVHIYLSSVGSSLGFRATYSVTTKPSVGETIIQMGYALRRRLMIAMKHIDTDQSLGCWLTLTTIGQALSNKRHQCAATCQAAARRD